MFEQKNAFFEEQKPFPEGVSPFLFLNNPQQYCTPDFNVLTSDLI